MSAECGRHHGVHAHSRSALVLKAGRRGRAVVGVVAVDVAVVVVVEAVAAVLLAEWCPGAVIDVPTVDGAVLVVVDAVAAVLVHLPRDAHQRTERREGEG